ncbi:MAG: N-glycosylase/DNA lyase [Candidatus Zapsychrus exili]|nr:N-glycosylase/DNA lyase [Candidatus Zapsychrus exili]
MLSDTSVNVLIAEYNNKKASIKKRLKEFRLVFDQPEKRIFSELCFCVCTPQSKAVYCDKAIKLLEKNGNLLKGSLKKIREGLAGVRFPNNKARFIFETRKKFLKGASIKIKERIDVDNILETREWFADNVLGIGLKEASHFLRNIGFGRDLAILDVHIFKNLIKYDIIKEKPKSLTKKVYLYLEDELKKFSKKVKIPMDELDLLFWSNETGEIFK